jgi:hypothetical protein
MSMKILWTYEMNDITTNSKEMYWVRNLEEQNTEKDT